jgi:hypothetical protein
MSVIKYEQGGKSVKVTAMLGVALPLAAIVLAGPTQSQQLQTGVAYSPGRSFDQLSWSAFVAAVTPARPPAPAGLTTFETWATDADTFQSTPPVWPDFNLTAVAATRSNNRFQASALERAHRPTGLQEAPAAQVAGVPTPCKAPGNAAAGNFPTPAATAPPSDCVAEEVRRNYAAWHFIVENKLYTQADLAKAFTGPTITFPKDAVELKMDWMPVDTVAAWLNNNGESANGASVTADFVRKNYYITKQPDGTEYAMVSMHISTKDRPNWLWATFEHQSNPGRCDTTGCYDDYGAPVLLSKIAPRQVANTQYPDCIKSAELLALFAKAGLPAVWRNYCLKGTQVDFVSTQPLTKGQPLLDGDSVIERITANVPINQSSCISCHAYASFGSDGCVYFATNPGLAAQGPIGNVTPQAGQKSYDFVWGLITINYAKACFNE